MSEHQARESLVRNGEALAAQNEVQLTSQEAAVLFAYQRVIAAIGVECQMLAQNYGQREAAGELASAADHIQKAQARFLAKSQSKILIPKPGLVLK